MEKAKKPRLTQITLVLEEDPTRNAHFQSACAKTDCPKHHREKCPSVFVSEGKVVREFKQFLEHFPKLGYTGRILSRMVLIDQEGPRPHCDYRVFLAPKAAVENVLLAVSSGIECRESTYAGT